MKMKRKEKRKRKGGPKAWVAYDGVVLADDTFALPGETGLKRDVKINIKTDYIYK
jgi:hypothetical protein